MKKERTVEEFLKSDVFQEELEGVVSERVKKYIEIAKSDKKYKSNILHKLDRNGSLNKAILFYNYIEIVNQKSRLSEEVKNAIIDIVNEAIHKTITTK